MDATIINKFGKIAGWNSITLIWFGRKVEAIVSIEYHDKQTKQNEYGIGRYPIGQSEGNYETENCALELYMEEIIALQKSMNPGQRIMDAPATDITITYEYQGQIITDVLRNASPMNNGRLSRQNEGKVIQKIDLLASHIDWSIK